MTEQDKRQKELDKQLDEQLTETIALARKLREVTEDNTLTMTVEDWDKPLFRYLVKCILTRNNVLKHNNEVIPGGKETRFLIERRCLSYRPS